MIARISIDGTASGRLFDYAVPPALTAVCAVGARVRVHFGRRAALGYVVELGEDSDFLASEAKETAADTSDLLLDVEPDHKKPALRPIEAIDGDQPVILAPLMRLARWMAQYYLAPIERCIQTLLPAPVRSGRSREMVRLYVEAVSEGDGGRDEARPSPGDPTNNGGRDEARPSPGDPTNTGGRDEARPSPGDTMNTDGRDKARPSPGDTMNTDGRDKARPSPRHCPDDDGRDEARPSPEALKLTKRQAELVADIQRVGGGWLQQVVAEFKCTAETLRRLEKLGALTITERQRRRDPFANRRVLPSKPLPLNEEQGKALRLIRDASALADDPSAPSPRPVLLFGVTGSGKTEVYLQAIAAVLAAGRGAIVLVPEIALTPQTVQRFAARFGENIAVLHSALSDGERFDEWRRIRDGKARVVVGPRSAVFAPVEKLGLIVVDEEHEPSYKQDETPRYNARDVAVMRAHLEHCAIVLGSATPALESWKNVQTGKYVLARLSRRAAEDAVMPLVHIVDMRREIGESGQVRLFSQALLDAIRQRLDRGEQTLLFLNRRGYSTSLVCPSCGYVATCEACDVAYTYHRHDDCLRCHICGDWRRVADRCPVCGDPKYKCLGTGTQRIEQIISTCFPHARIARMDADSTSRKMSHDDILGAFKAGKTDILIGTQMIAKGLHFPNVTLVGIVMADSSLHIPDFRAGERTFQLLAQVSGRTGRGVLAGEVYVQTYTPDHPAVQMARTENFEGFAAGELEVRRSLNYPPYCHLTCLTLSGPDESAVAALLERIAASIRGAAEVTVSEVVPASLPKANNQFRYQLLLRAPTTSRILPPLSAALAANRVPDAMRLAVDVDALSLC